MTRIVIVDSHKLFRASLSSLLNSYEDMEVIADISSLKELPSNFAYNEADVVIYDPENSSDTEFESIRYYFSYTPLVLLTDECSRPNILRFMEKNISGFFSKSDSAIQLRMAITRLTGKNGFEGVHLGDEVRKRMVRKKGKEQSGTVEFTPREIEILRLVCCEKTNAEISEALGLSIRTIESHRRRMIDKLECKSIIGVILNAIKFNSLPFPNKDSNTTQAS